MRKVLNVFFILILFTYPLEANAAGFGAITKFLKGMGKMFKKGADEVPDIGKTIEDFKGRNTNIGSKIDETINTPSQIDNAASIRKFEEKIVSDIENLNTEHLLEAHNVKNYTRKEKILHIADLVEGAVGLDVVIETVAIYPFVHNAWDGKVFRSSSYFNSPEIKEKIMISCKNNFATFYFTAVFSESKKNWLLFSGIVNEKENHPDNSLEVKQNLLVIKDLKEYIFFSNKAKAIKKYPSKFFFISDNAKFIYLENFDGKESPDYFEKNAEEEIEKSFYKCERIL